MNLVKFQNGRNDAKAEAPVLWTAHAKSWLIGKDSDAGRDWGQKEKGTTKVKMAGWHHGLDGRESEWTLGVGDGQGGLACCDSWGRKESDTTEQLNWNELMSVQGELHSKASKILTFRFFRRKWHWSPVAKKSTPWAHSWLGSLPQRASLGCTWDKAFPYSNCQHGS